MKKHKRILGLLFSLVIAFCGLFLPYIDVTKHKVYADESSTTYTYNGSNVMFDSNPVISVNSSFTSGGNFVTFNNINTISGTSYSAIGKYIWTTGLDFDVYRDSRNSKYYNTDTARWVRFDTFFDNDLSYSYEHSQFYYCGGKIFCILLDKFSNLSSSNTFAGKFYSADINTLSNDLFFFSESTSGLTSVYGNGFWTDGYHMFYSRNNITYMYDNNRWSVNNSYPTISNGYFTKLGTFTYFRISGSSMVFIKNGISYTVRSFGLPTGSSPQYYYLLSDGNVYYYYSYSFIRINLDIDDINHTVSLTATDIDYSFSDIYAYDNAIGSFNGVDYYVGTSGNSYYILNLSDGKFGFDGPVKDISNTPIYYPINVKPTFTIGDSDNNGVLNFAWGLSLNVPMFVNTDGVTIENNSTYTTFNIPTRDFYLGDNQLIDGFGEALIPIFNGYLFASAHVYRSSAVTSNTMFANGVESVTYMTKYENNFTNIDSPTVFAYIKPATSDTLSILPCPYVFNTNGTIDYQIPYQNPEDYWSDDIFSLSNCPYLQFLYHDGNGYVVCINIGVLGNNLVFPQLEQRTYYINVTNVSNISYNNGYNSGYTTGSSDGYSNGYSVGYTAGYSQGHIDGINDTETYSFANLLGAIIDVPITTFSSLFDFELLGVNLSGFFFALLTCCVVFAIIRLI